MANRYLALDENTGTDVAALPSGMIVGLAPTRAALEAAGFTPAAGYTGNRVAIIDDAVDGWNNDVVPGWHYRHAVAALRVVQEAVPLSAVGERKRKVAADIAQFKSVFREKEDIELPNLLAREKVDTVIDSGHSWVDDILHSWVKPWLRLVESKLATAKASPTQSNIDAYATDLADFLRMADTPGLLGFWSGANRSEWRPLRDGTVAWEYDTADGGTLAGSNRAVTYPTGFTVATWSAYAAIGAL